ncbi:hypothetical protein [Streptomyces capitiformicae]|uniref:Uncharacterized protein n=1 Tax=Streptomyces capitiformicae TaxID=2014920 RepID=A0A919DAE9_9ACTN|nr:hypothetical protein [Streptomyces capitiformicae]GHE32081.1 hypothetical protein GCM10017771_48680 [Streptomyces capitiformicae]
MATATEPRTMEQTAPASPGPVLVAITPRPTTPGPLPVAITSRPIADDEIRITTEIGTFSESLGCSCQADDDQPY